MRCWHGLHESYRFAKGNPCISWRFGCRMTSPTNALALPGLRAANLLDSLEGQKCLFIRVPGYPPGPPPRSPTGTRVPKKETGQRSRRGGVHQYYGCYGVCGCMPLVCPWQQLLVMRVRAVGIVGQTVPCVWQRFQFLSPAPANEFCAFINQRQS